MQILKQTAVEGITLGQKPVVCGYQVVMHVLHILGEFSTPNRYWFAPSIRDHLTDWLTGVCKYLVGIANACFLVCHNIVRLEAVLSICAHFGQFQHFRQ